MTREHSLIEQLDGLSNAENVDKKFDEREGRQNEQSLPGTYNCHNPNSTSTQLKSWV